MASDTTKTSISNLALGWLSVKRITSIETTDTSLEAVRCRMHYDQTREELLRQFDWPFAITRISLSNHEDTPAFDWDYQFDLPTDYLRFLGDQSQDDSNDLGNRWTVESGRILTNQSTLYLLYIRNEDDPTKFDPLFISVLALSMAVRMGYQFAGTGNITHKLVENLEGKLDKELGKARTACRRETDASGRSNWNWAKFRNTTGRPDRSYS